MKLLGKVLVLFDYENFHVSASRDLKLSIQEKGLKFLFEHIKSHASTNNNDIIVSADWDNFRLAKKFFQKNLVTMVEMIGNGSNIADGYLITSGLLRYEQMKKENTVELVIIISGDGVYTGLVEHCLRNGSKVIIYSWEHAFSSALEINEDVTTYMLDNVFGINEGKHLSERYFEAFLVTNAEYAIIARVLNSKYNDIYFKKTVRDIVRASNSDERYKEFDTEEKAKAFLNNCKDQGIFNKTKKLGSKGLNEITVFELNHNSEKVKFVKENERKRRRTSLGA